MNDNLCPSCRYPLPDQANYCPKCGKQIHISPVSLGVGKIIAVSLLSFFLPPLGLWPAIKYFRNGDETARKIGILAIILTVISIALTAYIILGIINSVNSELNSQLGSLSDYGLQ